MADLISEEMAVIMNGCDKVANLISEAPPWEKKEYLQEGVESLRRTLIRMGVLLENSVASGAISKVDVAAGEAAVLLLWPASPLNERRLTPSQPSHEA